MTNKKEKKPHILPMLFEIFPIFSLIFFHVDINSIKVTYRFISYKTSDKEHINYEVL